MQPNRPTTPALAKVIDAVLYMLRNAALVSQERTNIPQAVLEFERYQDRKQGYAEARNMLEFLARTEKNPHVGAMLVALQDILVILGGERGDI